MQNEIKKSEHEMNPSVMKKGKYYCDLNQLKEQIVIVMIMINTCIRQTHTNIHDG